MSGIGIYRTDTIHSFALCCVRCVSWLCSFFPISPPDFLSTKTREPSGYIFGCSDGRSLCLRVEYKPLECFVRTFRNSSSVSAEFSNCRIRKPPIGFILSGRTIIYAGRRLTVSSCASSGRLGNLEPHIVLERNPHCKNTVHKRNP